MGCRRALLALAGALSLGACTSVATGASSLEGSHWRVAAINGRATPGGDGYFLQFEDGKLGGRFGCNSFGGAYTVNGEQLVASNVVSTLMGCPEPAASFETEGLAVLQQPMRIGWPSSTRLMLSNSAGSIQLQSL